MCMKNKILLVLFSISLLSCKNNKINLLIGENITIKDCDFVEELEKEFETSYNSDFLTSRFYIDNFYSLLEKDGLNLITNNSILSLLKNTDEIIFNIGNYELLRLINYTELNLEYDEQVVNSSLEKFDYYLHNSLDILISYTPKINVIPLYNSIFLEENAKQKYNQLINRYNEVVLTNCQEHNVKYTDVSKLSYFVYKDNQISQKGLTYLFKQIRGTNESSL